ncbi:hypothetical protein [Paraburkholderia sp. HD33-4]|uniref:hypothetical protein n=1 Tax=Paraburkholderia sp. HD33-4 TaxID=2883242 RepID=UPI001F4147AF|nr:hypothetical protein [Paraburkholderia sp. HD33-4]
MLLLLYARVLIMSTFHRRRQWRDKQVRQPVTFEQLMKADLYIGLHIAITGFFLAVLLMLLVFGERFVNLF